ncbi:MAG: MlaD family protein [Bacteroidota bacterium]|nr:MlaD family protein [Bacteroidota bacterium]
MNEFSNKRIVIVGLFIFLGIALFISAILLIGDLHKTFEKKFQINLYFDDVAGLQKGDNVWLSGVKVGTIDNISFYGNSKVKVSAMIDEKAQMFIPKDSKVKLSSDGLIGHKILVICNGSPNAGMIKDGGSLMVETTFSSDDILNTLQENNKNILAITSDFKELSKKIVSGEGTIGKLIDDNSVYTDIKDATNSMHRLTQNAQKIIQSLASFSSNLNKEGTLANDLISDTITFKSIKASVLQVQQMTNNAETFISKIKQDENNLNSPLGVLLHNDQTGVQLKETFKNLEYSSRKLSEDLDALQQSRILKRLLKKNEKAKQNPLSAK